ncbi:MAG: class I SAM-dependent rRNA methyltransferase [Chitinophagales bacterium]
MLQNPRVVLLNHKADAVKRFHPWIFSGAIKFKEKTVQENALVDAVDEKGNFLATGYYSNGSIAVRVLSFRPVASLESLFAKRIHQAWQLRTQVGLAHSNATNAFRLINAEGDGIPGLIVDFYNGTAVLQAHAPFIYAHRELIAKQLAEVLQERLQAVYCKSEATLGRKSGMQVSDGYLFGSSTQSTVSENNLLFEVDWQEGQKTGFFLDQRDNRQLLGDYSVGKKVLNTFCYTGGFSVYALANEAELVHSVDSSEKAIVLTDKNVQRNFGNELRHRSYAKDVFDFLKESEDQFYDLIILDPPAFAKGHGARHQAVQAYKRLNQMAFSKIKSGGLIFTFSCSQAVGPELFEGAVMAGAIEAQRNIKILHHLAQPADHPQSVFHSEGLYLKGLVLFVA